MNPFVFPAGAACGATLLRFALAAMWTSHALPMVRA